MVVSSETISEWKILLSVFLYVNLDIVSWTWWCTVPVQELVPLLLAAINLHPEAWERDALLNLLFNLTKRPDEDQRRVILAGLLSVAQCLGHVRVESELLPQCWEQVCLYLLVAHFSRLCHKVPPKKLLTLKHCPSCFGSNVSSRSWDVLKDHPPLKFQHCYPLILSGCSFGSLWYVSMLLWHWIKNAISSHSMWSEFVDAQVLRSFKQISHSFTWGHIHMCNTMFTHVYLYCIILRKAFTK